MPALKLTTKDKKEINKFRDLFPREIIARVHRSEDGGFSIEILTYPGCFTEAETFSELIEMINDAVRTYFEIPEKYRSYMPTYLPSLEMAQHFGIFPVIKSNEELILVKS